MAWNTQREWVSGPAQGVTWLEIDSDGWCDALLSIDLEAAQRPGLPIILSSFSSALFFDPTRAC
jgi:hypothetical protein